VLGARPALAAKEFVSSWTLFMNPGVSFAGSTTSEYKLNTGFALQKTTVKDRPSRALELELAFTPPGIFGMAAIFSGVPYRTEREDDVDKQFDALLEPMIRLGEREGLVFWAGVGVGMRWLQLGETLRPGSGVNYELQQASPIFVWMPRAGIDYVLEGYTFGLHGLYSRETRTFQGVARDIGTGITAPMTLKQSRSWWGAEVRFGFQL
jgi:hypothetical protein